MGEVPLYRGTSLIRKRLLPGPCSRAMNTALWWPSGGGAVSYERGTPVSWGMPSSCSVSGALFLKNKAQALPLTFAGPGIAGPKLPVA